MRGLRIQHAALSQDDVARLAEPASARQVLGPRLTELSEQTRALFEAAAVLGSQIDAQLLKVALDALRSALSFAKPDDARVRAQSRHRPNTTRRRESLRARAYRAHE